MTSSNELDYPQGDDYSEGSSISSDEMPEENLLASKTMRTGSCQCMFGAIEALDFITGKFLTYDLKLTTISCLINSLSAIYNSLIEKEEGEITWRRIYFADTYFRLRHEILCKLTVESIGLSYEKSDIPFSHFGVDSNRTPDYIIKDNEGGYIIMEMTAGTSEEKAFQTKGVESAGFESKYQKEIDLIRRSGLAVSYYVFHFNMKNPENSSAYTTLAELESEHGFISIDTKLQILKSACKDFSNLTLTTQEYLSAASSLLFLESFKIEPDHPNIDFIFDKTKPAVLRNYDYVEYNISLPVYQKVNNLWFRLHDIKRRSFSVEGAVKVRPVLDMSDNKIYFESGGKGAINNSDMDDILMSNNRKSFLDLLLIKVAGKYVKATDSTTGVKFVKREPSNKLKALRDYSLELLPSHYLVEITETTFFRAKFMEECRSKEESNRQKDYYLNYYDPDYERLYFDSIQSMDEECSEDSVSETFTLKGGYPVTLANCATIDFKIDELIDCMKRELIEKNSFELTLPVRSMKMKSSFILPLAFLNEGDRCSLSHKNMSFLNLLKNSDIGGFTRHIISKVIEPTYNFHNDSPPPNIILNDLYSERYKLSSEVTRIVKNCMRSNNNVFKKSLLLDGLATFEDLNRKIKNINVKIKKEEKDQGITKNIEFVRVNLSKGNEMSLEFNREMRHFKDRSKMSSFEGIGLGSLPNCENMYKALDQSFNDLKSEMCNYSGVNNDFLIDLNTYDDCKVLKQLKDKSMKDYDKIINSVKNSYLGHASALVSRLGHSLCFYSQLPFNKSYTRVDNLGYKNVLLIVRGGSKIFKTKSSKLFRLIFPVSENIMGHYIDSSYGESSFKRVIHEGRNYIVTPWALMHESILLDSISFYPRVCSFCVLNSKPEETFYNQIDKYFLNVLLAFHNRRGTEDMLANFRYILLSTMGDYSSYNTLLTDFMGFNYDKVQAYIRLSLLENYGNYVDGMRYMQSQTSFNSSTLSKAKIRHIITGYEIDDIDDLALMIYSTFLMTKAPYQRHVERANNLKGILSINKLYNDTVGLELSPQEQLERITVCVKDKVGNSKSYKQYSTELMESDFKIDPYYCTQVGCYADSYFKQTTGKDVIIKEWIKILNTNWDSMATTTGLRGEENENFWGQKGYFVIYDKILNDENYKDKISSILLGSDTDDEKRKSMRKVNQSYYGLINDKPDTLIYHAVDKRQWRGGREIYVMDLKTKRMQQPIEKFMGFLCKKTDNELISIPSDKRSQVIHHSLFERDVPDKDLKTWFWTFDCSKWAPKSIFVKFALMIAPMSCIPQTFKNHFYNYLSRLYKKRLYFNYPEVKALTNSLNSSKETEAWLIEDKDKKGVYMVQPYSWVMGIFNYTSSLMHAFNQKYCSYILRESTMSYFNEDCQLTMFAHSDDSGGRITLCNDKVLIRSLFIYEVNLKACNHLLSRKKCVVSRVYFEILSIIYMFSQLLALLPKFLGGLRFSPTDKGPCHDMMQSYSKCNELMVMGADFSTAYIYMKFYSAEIWRFYHHKAPTPSDYLRPPQHLGMPDAHPLMVLLSGSDSDIIRIIYTNGYKNLIIVNKLLDYFQMQGEGEGFIRPLKFEVRVRNIGKNFSSALNIMENLKDKWTLSNVNFRNTLMNSVVFLRKLSDPGFTGSLINETEVRRLSRAYFFRSGKSVITKYGNKKLEFIMDIINEVTLIERVESKLFLDFFGEDTLCEYREEVSVSNDKNKPFIEYHRDIYSGLLKLYGYLDRLDYNDKKLRSVIRTLKPTHVQIVKFNRGFNSEFDPTQMVSLVYEPEFSWALPNPNNLIEGRDQYLALLSHIGLSKEDLSPNAALKLVRAHSNKSTKEIYMYSSVPSHIRSVRNYSTIMSFLATNAFKGYEIHGMTANLRSGLVSSPAHEVDIDSEAYTICTMLDVLCSLSKSINLNRIDFNKIQLLNFEGGDAKDLITCVKSRYFSDSNYCYYKHYADYLDLACISGFRKSPAIVLEDSAFYTFLKEQKYNGAWYGRGSIYFAYKKSWVILEILNSKIINGTGNLTGKIDKLFSSFLSDCLKDNNLNPSFSDSIEVKSSSPGQLYLGFDLSGDLAVENCLNTRQGFEFTYKIIKPSILGRLRQGELEYVKENLFVLKSEDQPTLKIKTLKIERGEVMPIIKMMVNPESIRDHLTTNSFDDFTDFIDQIIMPDYGSEYYITLNDLKDGFLGSELHRIMSFIQSDYPELLPNKFKTSQLPAANGSLLRMVLQYQDKTGVEILRMPNNINPSIMSIRNEYPEAFSVILNEKMCESFGNIYNDSEQLMLYNEFTNAASGDDIELTKKRLIRLMCYWGYSALVNTVEIFSFSRNVKNHKIFNIQNLNSIDSGLYNQYFIKLLHATRSAMISTISIGHHDQKLVKNIFEDSDLDKLFTEYAIEVVYNSYNYSRIFQCPSVGHMKFNNLLIAFIADPKFNNRLTECLKDDYPLNTLDFNPGSQDEVIATYNTLRLMYIMSRSKDNRHDLNFLIGYEHLPHKVLSPLSIIKEMRFARYKAARLKYHYFLDDFMKSSISKREVTVHSGGVRYLVKQEVGKLKNSKISVHDSMKYKNVLSEDFLDSEEFEEIDCEFATGDPDLDTVNEYIEAFGDIYEKTKIVKRGRTWVIPVKWVVMPYIESQVGITQKMNNTGENVVLLSNCLVNNFHWLRGGHVYLVNYKDVNADLGDMFAHVMCNTTLPLKFWDKYIGGVRLNSYKTLGNLCKVRQIRETGVVVRTDQAGKTFQEMIAEHLMEKDGLIGHPKSNEDVKKDEGIITVGEIEVDTLTEDQREAAESINRINKLKILEMDMKNLIDECCENNVITKEKAEKMFLKYKLAARNRIGLSSSELMSSLFTEIDLNTMNSQFYSGEVSNMLTENDSIKMMQAPESMGAAYSHSKPDTKAFKNIKIKCEMEAIHPSLAQRVSSGTLKISEDMLKIMRYHYNTWRLAVDNTRKNRECKQFFLNLFLSAINDASTVKRSKQDHIWQETINNLASIIGEEDESDKNELFYRVSPTRSLRLKYRTVGN